MKRKSSASLREAFLHPNNITRERPPVRVLPAEGPLQRTSYTSHGSPQPAKVQAVEQQPPKAKRRASFPTLNSADTIAAAATASDARGANQPAEEPGPSQALLQQVHVPAAPFTIDGSFISTSRMRVIREGDLDLLFCKGFIPPSKAAALYAYLLESLPWHRVAYQKGGLQIVTPRYTTVFGLDETRGARGVSAYHRPARAIPAALQQLVDTVSDVTGSNFNFTLLNFYSSGNDSISYHSDDETFLGSNPSIASLSLGGSRDFYLKHKKSKKQHKYLLESGDLLVMRGSTQSNWLHAVPKRGGTVLPRINITLRKAISVAGTNNYYRYNVGDGLEYRWVDGNMTATDRVVEEPSVQQGSSTP